MQSIQSEELQVCRVSLDSYKGYLSVESKGAGGSLGSGGRSSSLKTISSGTSRISSGMGGGRGRRGTARVLFFVFVRFGMLALSQEYWGLARTKVTRK